MLNKNCVADARKEVETRNEDILMKYCKKSKNALHIAVQSVFMKTRF